MLAGSAPPVAFWSHSRPRHMKEAAYQEYMKNTRIAQAVAQAEREAAAAAAHAAESAERAAKQKGHTHVPPEAPSTTGGTTNAPPSKPALQRMSTQAIQAKVKSKWAFRAAVAGLIFALPSLALHVVPMVWTGYLWSRSVDTNAQSDTGVQTFLYWTALLSLFLNVNRLLCRGVLPCLFGSSQEGKEEEDTFRKGPLWIARPAPAGFVTVACPVASAPCRRSSSASKSTACSKYMAPTRPSATPRCGKARSIT